MPDAPNLNGSELQALLRSGNEDAIRRYATKIASNAGAVMTFERAWDALDVAGSMDWRGSPEDAATCRKLIENFEELDAFLAPVHRAVHPYFQLVNHGTDCTVELGWDDSQHGRVVWERWTEPVGCAAILFAQLGHLFARRQYLCEVQTPVKADPPLYRFHPERFKAFRDYTDPVGKIYRHKIDPVSGLGTLDDLNEIMGHVVREATVKGMSYPRKRKDALPMPSMMFDAEEALSSAYGRFVQCGRQIMDFPPQLTEMLANTDIDDIPLQSIKLPYNSVFIHFGEQVALEIEPGWHVDGAYVESRGNAGDIKFTVTAIPTDHALSRDWYVVPEPEYTQDFIEEFRTMDLATAIDTVLADRIDALKERSEKRGGDITDQARNILSDRGVVVPPELNIVDVSSASAIKREAATWRRHPIYKSALQLVVNALCYVTSYPDDVATVWPDGAPQSLVQKAIAGKGKERVRATSKLASLGYVPVHICGQRIVEQRSAAHVGTSSQVTSLATHWRRGHWRSQAHGQGRVLRKMIWLMPTLVGAQDEVPAAGHVYLVDRAQQ